MLTASRCLWLVVLGAVLNGCAGGYKTIPLPSVDPHATTVTDADIDIATDEFLRLHLRDGTVVSGYLMRIQAGNLMLRDVSVLRESQITPAEIAQPEDVTTLPTATYPLTDIERIERYERDSFGPAYAAGILAGTVVLFVAMDNFLDDFPKN